MISIIITTYNRPDALALVLHALQAQTDRDFEVLIADDGSDEKTQLLLEQLKIKLHYPIKHVWQTDQGFRAATIRNKAVAQSLGNYLIFLDGDCVPLPYFVARHRQLAEKNYFTVGQRVLCNAELTQHVLNNATAIYHWPFLYWCMQKLRGRINRIAPFFYLPGVFWRKWREQKWQGAKTCNLALYRQDFVRVNGFDEAYQGWGYEDSDLIIRLLKMGVRRKSGQCATMVLHLWHKLAPRDQQGDNYQRLLTVQQKTQMKAEQGVDQYIGAVE